MHTKEFRKYLKYKTFQSKKFYHFIVIPILMVLVYLLVYYTDNKVYSHAMYIPIIYASFALDMKFSSIIGLIGGIILGPLIPFSVSTGEPQEAIQWVFRLIMFFLVGIFSGLLINVIRNNSLKIIDLLSLDPLTNLPNEHGLKLLEPTMNLQNQRIVISFIINNHEVLLELFGINMFSKLIIEISKIIKSELSDSIVIHSGGNKLWITTNLLDKELIIVLIQKRLNDNIDIEGISFFVDYYIGINIIKNKHYDLHKEFINADISARYASKNQLIYAEYDNNYSFYKNEFNIVGSFSKAITNNELSLVYQPIIDLKTRKIEKLEALIRWKHPLRGFISPDEFIPLIEQTQLIHKLTNWVVINVIKKIEEFEKEKIDIGFSINISAKNLYDPSFVDKIINIKNEYNIKDNQIELEITESMELIDNSTSQQYLKRLRDNGFLIAIDDFGKGYSSLSNLHTFPATTLKIDKYFSKQMETNNNIIYIVEGIIDFAHKLGLNTIFEGIETKDIDNLVKEIKSDYAQGYYYSKPIKSDDIINFYKQKNGVIH